MVWRGPVLGCWASLLSHHSSTSVIPQCSQCSISEVYYTPVLAKAQYQAQERKAQDYIVQHAPCDVAIIKESSCRTWELSRSYDVPLHRRRLWVKHLSKVEGTGDEHSAPQTLQLRKDGSYSPAQIKLKLAFIPSPASFGASL